MVLNLLMRADGGSMVISNLLTLAKWSLVYVEIFPNLSGKMGKKKFSGPPWSPWLWVCEKCCRRNKLTAPF